ncbi:MAG: beta-lactamase family protein [Bacteroidetes bacterium]|nr:beta-lactamase family protein [Bacteroidota bacterium]
MFLLKTILQPIAGICFFAACTQPSGNQQAIAAVQPDTLHPAPPVQTITQEEFTHYNRACSSFFDSLLLRHPGFNGSILVAKDGEVVYEKNAGFVNPASHKDTLTSNSAFHLASVSKTFTAMATLKLWEEGRLSLEDDLSKYFPKFPYPGITVKMLLSHRSGLPNYVHYMEIHGWNKKKMVTNTDVLLSLYTMHPGLEFTSGKHFSYCNTNFALLALIIEKVSGHSYADYLKQTFFTPLGMNDTYVFNLNDTSTAMLSYEANNRPFRMEYLDAVYGDKNIYSTTHDLLKWDQALYSGKLFKQATLDSAFAGYSWEKEGKRNYGLGWRMTFLDNGKKILYHNGWWHGNNNVFIRLLDEKATIIVLGNRYNRRIYSSKGLCDLFGPYRQSHNGLEETEGTGGNETVKTVRKTTHRKTASSTHKAAPRKRKKK